MQLQVGKYKKNKTIMVFIYQPPAIRDVSFNKTFSKHIALMSQCLACSSLSMQSIEKDKIDKT